jgi:hypothetical protein
MKFSKAEKLMLLWIPVIAILGGLMHFVFELCSNSAIVGIFAPVNESVWEHLKMAFYPMLIWWIVFYIICGKKNNIPFEKYVLGGATAIIAAPLIILIFFYTYTGALGIESLVLDIFSLFLGVAVGQILGVHIYKYSKANFATTFISILILCLMVIAFTSFTFYPPHLPLFQNSLTGTYGI